MKSKTAVWAFIFSLSPVLVAVARLADLAFGKVSVSSSGVNLLLMTAIILAITLVIVSVILGISSLVLIKRNMNLEGRGLAITALVIDGIYILFFLIGSLLFSGG
jgi:hypothetical protein